MRGEYHHKFKVPAAAVYDAFYFTIVLRCYNYIQGSKLFPAYFSRNKVSQFFKKYEQDLNCRRCEALLRKIIVKCFIRENSLQIIGHLECPR